MNAICPLRVLTLLVAACSGLLANRDGGGAGPPAPKILRVDATLALGSHRRMSTECEQ